MEGWSFVDYYHVKTFKNAPCSYTIRDRIKLLVKKCAQHYNVSYYVRILLVKFMTNLLSPKYLIWQLGSHA